MNEQIEMYRGVQKFKGELRPGDVVLHEGEIAFVVGVPRLYGEVLIVNITTHNGMKAVKESDTLWLPPPTPRWPGDDEKRTLWGILRSLLKVGEIMVEDTGDECAVYCWADVMSWEKIDSGNTLPEALLRAIAKEG